jgi:predicted NBD/HSP70 family sugar kinase
MNESASHGWPAGVDLPGDEIAREIRLRAERLDHGLYGIGVEILPYKLIAVVIDDEGNRLAGLQHDLVSMEPDDVVDGIAEVAREVADEALGLDLLSPRLCLGVELGGPVDSEAGIVNFYVNNPHDHGKAKPPYQWDEIDLADRIQRATGCITVLENDAHAHAVYEQMLGAGRRSASFAVLLIRHGVGAGVVIDNQLVPIPAEVGHLPAFPPGRDCDCGKGSHVESRAGRRAIPAVVAEKLGLPKVMAYEWAVDEANRGRPEALEAFAEAGTAIAQGLAAILAVFGVPHVVVYGPDSLVLEQSGPAAETFLRNARTFGDYTFGHLRNCEITMEAIQPDRGACGAALAALNRHFSVSLEPTLEPVP